MNVKDAIALMAKHPAVGFPWEGTLVSLINGFLPAESQMDPHTAQAEEIQIAIDSLEASIREMVYDSDIGPSAIGYSPPRLPPVAPVPPPAAPAPAAVAKTTDTRTLVFWAFGVSICVIAGILALNAGSGSNSGDVVELLKLAVQLLLDKPAVDMPPPSQ